MRHNMIAKAISDEIIHSTNTKFPFYTRGLKLTSVLYTARPPPRHHYQSKVRQKPDLLIEYTEIPTIQI